MEKNIFFKLLRYKFVNNKRYDIYYQRVNWMKFVDLAKKYNLSRSRVQQIYLKNKSNIDDFYTEYYKQYWINI
jgi:Mor family transcriptional regulator